MGTICLLAILMVCKCYTRAGGEEAGVNTIAFCAHQVGPGVCLVYAIAAASGDVRRPAGIVQLELLCIIEDVA